MKLFTAGLVHETNTFSPLPTGLANYEYTSLIRGGVPEEFPDHITAPLVVWKQRAREQGWELVESLCAGTEPSGKTVKAVYEALRDEILDDLRQAQPVDVVMLRLHGAMVAEGYDDCEGDLIARCREIVGPAVILGAELDPHCHFTDAMLNNATALVIYKEFPHTDIAERAEDLFRIVAAAAAGKTHPVMSVFDCKMIGTYFTTIDPMKGFVDQCRALEGKDGVLDISPIHCFPYADVPELGSKMLVMTDNMPEKGAALARELGMQLIALRGTTRTAMIPLAEAVALAKAVSNRPLVLADSADNPGGGAPGDSTYMLRAFLEAGISNAVFACLFDPAAVQFCFAAGEGGELSLRIGGKQGPSSGDPVDLAVRVTKLHDSLRQRFGSAWNLLGPTAAVHGQGLDIILTSHRSQTFGIEPVTEMGIAPASRDVIVVKSTNHFRAAYEPIAADIQYVRAPGALSGDFASIPYTRLRRPIWPLDENPWDN